MTKYSLTVLPATIVSAQTAPGTGDTTASPATVEYNNEGRNGYWGLLGLLGLFGLMGRKNRDDSAAYREPGVPGETTGSRRY
ncbi:MAG: hypothetical protein HC780_08105 [Leptolyngbyaceae cyanobacterium CSU_1_3]|nr:hypothetical protein [Leptolyngbyaceae cyanobacterium CSU_1_3]